MADGNHESGGQAGSWTEFQPGMEAPLRGENLDVK